MSSGVERHLSVKKTPHIFIRSYTFMVAILTFVNHYCYSILQAELPLSNMSVLSVQISALLSELEDPSFSFPINIPISHPNPVALYSGQSQSNSSLYCHSRRWRKDYALGLECMPVKSKQTLGIQSVFHCSGANTILLTVVDNSATMALV